MLLGCGAIATLLIGLALSFFLSLNIPDIRSLDDYRPLVATTLLDRHGELLDFIGPEHRVELSLEQTGPYLAKAFVAGEDSRYWEHAGLDGWSILRAMVNNIRSGRRSQGGSTITQQVTRALMLSREKTYFRKLTEALLAYRLERMLSKEEILTIYLNEVYLGDGAYGVEAAAWIYFGKPAAQLTLGESAILAGLPQSPSRYAPWDHFEAARARQRYVLNRMAEDGLISDEAARSAYDEELHLAGAARKTGQNGWFADFVRELLEKKFGKEVLYRQGLVVTTTLDPRMQEHGLSVLRAGVQAVVAGQKDKTVPQGALLVVDGAGNIRAMVGGTEYGQSPFNRAVSAKRQPGSAFKPLIYATALERGLAPSLLLEDSPFAMKNGKGGFWRPHNFSGDYRGLVSMEDSLVHSLNIPTIRLLQKTGVKPVIALAGRAGISSPLQPDLTLALGSSALSLLELTGAYSLFQGEGLLHLPRAVIRVRDRGGREHPWPQPQPERVISPVTAQTMRHLLAAVVSRGTGKEARGIPGAAGKTGTSNDNRDAWFIGYAGGLTCGVWIGHDQGKTLGKGVTGGGFAAPVWKAFMEGTGK